MIGYINIEEQVDVDFIRARRRAFLRRGRARLRSNHRVNVARYHGVEMIEAEVTVFRTRSSLKRLQTAAA